MAFEHVPHARFIPPGAEYGLRRDPFSDYVATLERFRTRIRVYSGRYQNTLYGPASLSVGHASASRI
jgi:hypothetical protein